MKILLIHADYFEYNATQKAIKEAEELTDDIRRSSMEDVLVAFLTVEREDERDPEEIARRGSESIREVAERVGATNIMLYPYAHLSTNLSSTSVAYDVLRKLEESLIKLGFFVKRGPFGWYKSFTLKCKGHPLAESLRSVSLEEAKPKVEEVKKGEFIILDLEGNEHPVNLSKLDECKILTNHPLLHQFIIAEEMKMIPHETPAHIALMKKLELVDYEPASDVGHFRFYPKGALVKKLLEKFADDLAVKELNCMVIETPSIYRIDEKDIAEQVKRFRERDYRFKVGGRELTLRFAGDFGLFRLMKNSIISYKQLPIRMYELSHSYRLEKSGECVGLRRMRSFTMPDIHCFCRDLEEAMREFVSLLKCYKKLADSMEIDYVIAFRCLKEFYLSHRDWFKDLVKIAEKPALIELLPEKRHYWILKYESQFIDSVGGNAQLCTIQLDTEDSERYGMSYIDSDGSRKNYVIIHSSMGSIERWIYAILEQAAKMKKQGKAPMLPLWLSPIQSRILPVKKDHLDYALEIQKVLSESEIRADVDDRDLTLAKKVREAEMDWIPYIITIGDREKNEKFLTVRIRGGGIREMKVDELIHEIKERVKGMPFLPLSLPVLLSARVKFA